MSDETELTPQLSEGAGAIEAALRGVTLPDSAIDHDYLMYQAGWAAAMAECAQSAQLSQSVKAKPQVKPASRFWPALAMTFAASTAACLAVILLLRASESGVALEVAQHGSAQQKTVALKGDDATESKEDREAADAENTLFASTTVAPRKFGPGAFLGASMQKMMADRNAQFEKHLVEVTSPRQTFFRASDEARSFKRSEPLTLRSLESFSL